MGKITDRETPVPPLRIQSIRYSSIQFIVVLPRTQALPLHSQILFTPFYSSVSSHWKISDWVSCSCTIDPPDLSTVLSVAVAVGASFSTSPNQFKGRSHIIFSLIISPYFLFPIVFLSLHSGCPISPPPSSSIGPV